MQPKKTHQTPLFCLGCIFFTNSLAHTKKYFTQPLKPANRNNDKALGGINKLIFKKQTVKRCKRRKPDKGKGR